MDIVSIHTSNIPMVENTSVVTGDRFIRPYADGGIALIGLVVCLTQIARFERVESEAKIMDLVTFVSLIVVVFALVIFVAGAFAAIMGSGKSRTYGIVMALAGLIVGVLWTYLIIWSGIEPFCNVDMYQLFYDAVVNLAGVLIGALVAVGIFLVAVLKS